jgi:hypothetical protein
MVHERAIESYGDSGGLVKKKGKPTKPDFINWKLAGEYSLSRGLLSAGPMVFSPLRNLLEDKSRAVSGCVGRAGKRSSRKAYNEVKTRHYEANSIGIPQGVADMQFPCHLMNFGLSLQKCLQISSQDRRQGRTFHKYLNVS